MYLNDRSGDAPKLCIYLNTDNLLDLSENSVWPGLEGDKALDRLRQDGFDGVQVGSFVELFNADILPFCGLNRINAPDEADAVFTLHTERGDSCISLHVGWGMESDAELDRLVESVLNASEKFRLPAFIETHRATITQDMWRTVELTKRFPEVRFNGDFSHWYCGQEMVYGDFEAKLDFLQPVFDRVGFLHGRIASPGNMQVPVEGPSGRPLHAVGEPDYLADFKRMWQRAMAGFRRNAPAGSVLIFAPELLCSRHYYARMVRTGEGRLHEEIDRYAQARICKEIAECCFRTAVSYDRAESA